MIDCSIIGNLRGLMEGRRRTLSAPNADESVLGIKIVGGKRKGPRVLSFM